MGTFMGLMKGSQAVPRGSRGRLCGTYNVLRSVKSSMTRPHTPPHAHTHTPTHTTCNVSETKAQLSYARLQDILEETQVAAQSLQLQYTSCAASNYLQGIKGKKVVPAVRSVVHAGVK